MKLIIGLGNPGKKYQNNKHNVGFMAVDLLAQELLKTVKWNESKKAKCLYLKAELNQEIIEIIKPQAYMNNSGFTLAYIIKNNNIKPSDIFIIYDDLDIELGEIKIGFFDSAGGHNGIKDIINKTKIKDFLRFRIGIKTPLLNKIPADKYVLSKFSFLEKFKSKKSLRKIVEAVICAIEESPQKAMNKYN